MVPAQVGPAASRLVADGQAIDQEGVLAGDGGAPIIAPNLSGLALVLRFVAGFVVRVHFRFLSLLVGVFRGGGSGFELQALSPSLASP